ncbi:MAG: NUDIX hydrolase [Candidatus Moranbacteria bacterium]|nr:NUDIX hydrolase [Candidatus Moranbacteria bacterium]
MLSDCFNRTSAKALILDEEGRFLLMLEKKGVWELPGGGLDFGENPQQCLAREIQEEMGLEVVHIAERPKYFLTATRRDGQGWIANIIYEVRVADLDFVPSDECVEIRFFTAEEASMENLLPHVTEFVKLFNPTRE